MLSNSSCNRQDLFQHSNLQPRGNGYYQSLATFAIYLYYVQFTRELGIACDKLWRCYCGNWEYILAVHVNLCDRDFNHKDLRKDFYECFEWLCQSSHAARVGYLRGKQNGRTTSSSKLVTRCDRLARFRLEKQHNVFDVRFKINVTRTLMERCIYAVVFIVYL